jgi:hypothetical protein
VKKRHVAAICRTPSAISPHGSNPYAPLIRPVISYRISGGPVGRGSSASMSGRLAWYFVARRGIAGTVRTRGTSDIGGRKRHDQCEECEQRQHIWQRAQRSTPELRGANVRKRQNHLRRPCGGAGCPI